MATKLRVDVWADIACPWCWIGKRRLEAALDLAGERDTTDVVWRSYELFPERSLWRRRGDRDPGAHVERLPGGPGSSRADARARLEQIRAIAATEGLDLRFDRVRPTNLFDAHRVLHLALDRDVQAAVVERFFRAYFTEGARMSDHDTLVALGADCGLDPEEIRTTLAGDIYADDVEEDEMEAAELGILGVPFFVIGGRDDVAGAQAPSVIAAALGEARRRIEAIAPPSLYRPIEPRIGPGPGPG